MRLGSTPFLFDYEIPDVVDRLPVATDGLIPGNSTSADHVRGDGCGKLNPSLDFPHLAQDLRDRIQIFRPARFL